MSYQEVQPATVRIESCPPNVPFAQAVSDSSRLSLLCLTGEMGIQVKHIPIVVAAYVAFALFGTFVFAVVNASWWLLIPVVGGLIAGSVSIYFLHRQEQLQVQTKRTLQVDTVAAYAAYIEALKARIAREGKD